MLNLLDNPESLPSKYFQNFSLLSLFPPDSKKRKTNRRLGQDSLAVEAAFIKPCNNHKNSGKLNIAEISTLGQASC